MFSLVVLAAGKGSRMKSPIPKVLHLLMGEPLLEYAIEKADVLGPRCLSVVIGHGREEIREEFSGRQFGENGEICWAVQEEQLGTAHAAKVGIESLFPDGEDSGDVGDVLIINGDLPLLRAETLQEMLDCHNESKADITVLTCVKSNPTGFGRIIRADSSDDQDGQLQDIIEEGDADSTTREIKEVNVGTYLLKPSIFSRHYQSISANNQQGERYLTDVVVQAARSGDKVVTIPIKDEKDTSQVNNHQELAAAQGHMKDRLINEHLESGVQIDDPSNTYIEKGVEISPGAKIHPFCVIRRGCTIGPGCEVGPFSHLRPGVVLEEGAKVGNFVEIKNSRMGAGSKTNHLSYIGDGDVGERVNIGAGTIFANYDGENKNKTKVKDGAFIGSGSVLVAPVTVGKNARTGAGSVILRGRDVPDGETVVGVPARPHIAKKDNAGKGQD